MSHHHDHDHCCHTHNHEDCCSSHHHHHDCCGDEHHHDHQSSYSDDFLALADEAWMEVLKEKIKENIRSNDKKLDELAKIISEANHLRWKKKMDKKHCQEDYRQKLHDYFDGDCCKK